MTEVDRRPDDEPGGGTPPEGTLRKVAVAAMSASTLEWYDFYIYGTAAALVFNQVFFSSVDPTLGTLAAFATFGVGFIFRPVGGVLFGHFGDRIGRKKLLVIAMVMMGASTTLIGALPTYATIGIAAPLLLVLMRCIQGIAVGGQYGGSMLLVTENAPAHRRGYFGSFAHMGPSLATILSNVTFLVLAAVLPGPDFVAWGWRIPFLLSVVVIALGLYMQLKLEDTPEFRALQAAQAKDAATNAGTDAGKPAKRGRSPIVEAIRTHPRAILQTTGMFISIQVFYYIMIVFVLSYVTQEGGVPKSTILTIILVASGVSVVLLPVFAAMSDRVGRKKVVMAGGLGILLVPFPFFWLTETFTVVGMTIAALLGSIVVAALYGPMAAFLTEMFTVEVRYSGASIGYQLAAVIGGGFAPLIAASLLASTGTINSVAAYVTLAGLISVVAIASTPDNYRPRRTAKQEVESST